MTTVTPGSVDNRRPVRVERGGDASAFEDLYSKTSGRAMAIATSILGSTAEAEEVVQDTFVAVWNKRQRWDPKRGNVESWIATITRNRAIDRLRSKNATKRNETRVMEHEPGAKPGVATPLDDAEQRQKRDRVRAVLAGLPAPQRAVIELTYYRGLTQKEIAKCTGEALGTIKSRVRLAMTALGKLLPTVLEESR